MSDLDYDCIMESPRLWKYASAVVADRILPLKCNIPYFNCGYEWRLRLFPWVSRITPRLTFTVFYATMRRPSRGRGVGLIHHWRRGNMGMKIITGMARYLLAIGITVSLVMSAEGTPANNHASTMAANHVNPFEFIYAANQAAENVSGYRIELKNGTLSKLPGSPYRSPFGASWRPWIGSSLRTR